MPLDIGMGIMLSLGVAHVFDMPATPLFVFLGIIFALLPDIDMLWYLLRKSRAHDHRSYPHYPLLWVPIIAGVYIVSEPIGILLLVCIALHLIHDTIGLGWGIRWLWPFSNKKFRFLSPTGNNGGWEFFRTWMPSEEEALSKQQHDPHWVRTYYLRPNTIGFVEYAVFLLGLTALYFYMF